MIVFLKMLISIIHLVQWSSSLCKLVLVDPCPSLEDGVGASASPMTNEVLGVKLMYMRWLPLKVHSLPCFACSHKFGCRLYHRACYLV